MKKTCQSTPINNESAQGVVSQSNRNISAEKQKEKHSMIEAVQIKLRSTSVITQTNEQVRKTNYTLKER